MSLLTEVSMQKIAFIGMGNMGQALVKALLKYKNKEDIIFTRDNQEKARCFERKQGIKYIDNIEELANKSKYIILAVKPQVYDKIFKVLKAYIRKEHIIISLAPGISTQSIKYNLGDVRVLRAMPNTPALLGEGMTGLSYIETEYSKEEIEELENIFLGVGKFIKIEEKYMDAVVCMSGSSPAYMYEFVDALATMGIKFGLSKNDSIKLVAQTMLGTAKMILETGEHPEVLKDKVCSPAGTTIEGVLALEENGFRKSIQKAAKACYNKCKELGN